MVSFNLARLLRMRIRVDPKQIPYTHSSAPFLSPQSDGHRKNDCQHVVLLPYQGLIRCGLGVLVIRRGSALSALPARIPTMERVMPCR